MLLSITDYSYLDRHIEQQRGICKLHREIGHHDPGALMKGGGVWANTTTKLQGMEAWLDAHPALLSLLQKTGSILGGAMWLKNLTPAGLVSYLVTNYGYDKVLKLLDGSIEVGKEQLCAYFLAHDKDITPEQARYLSNVSMQVLLTGGQVLVHKVTADGFKTGRKKNPKKQDSQKR